MLGIDLGTTNSLVSVWRDDKEMLIPNRYGSYLTPSAVYIGEDKIVTVGEGAIKLGEQTPNNVFRYFKRYMGTDKKYIVNGEGFTPIDFSSFVLRVLKEDAESYMGCKYTEAVISVPAYFNDQQRKATKVAAELAGLKVNRLINEPTAAAIAYGVQEKKDFSNAIILDLGGGTYDVSFLEYYCDIMEVKGTAGDVRLGGEDFTDCILDSFCKDCNISSADISHQVLLYIRSEMEKVKHRLSSEDSITVNLEVEGRSIQWSYSNDRFENDSQDILDKLRNPIERVIRDSRQSVNEIDDIVLVGGATRMPAVRKMITKMFQKFPIIHYNPDEVIGRGVGVLTGMIKRDDNLKEVVLTDVSAYSLGIEVSKFKGDCYESGYFMPIIDRNTILPVSKEEFITTIHDNQRLLSINIYQGESRRTNHNLNIGELQFDIPPLPKGDVVVGVRFTYDTSGLLEVEVCNKETNDVDKLIIKQNNTLSEEEINQKLEILQSYKINQEDKEVNIAFMEYLESCYEKYIGEKRIHIDMLAQRYENALHKLNDYELGKERHKIRLIIEELEGE